jgi:uncharacterized protein (TIGR02246 family)
MYTLQPPNAMNFRLAFLAYIALLIGCQPQRSANQPSADDIAAIRSVLAKQVNAWNEGNIDAFMEGYWKSDSLLFIGSKITYGWDSTLVRYKKSYPDKATMGQLRFDIMRVDFVSTDNYLVTGRYTLLRANDQPTGIFTLWVKRDNNGAWVVVYDHTS